MTTHARFEWTAVTTEYRGTLPTRDGEELRWLVNRERMRDTATGETFTRSIMRSPGVCVMAAVFPDDRIALVRQYRYPIGDEIWELPAGTLNARDEGGRVIALETPETCAARELVEETGYEAATLTRLAEWYAMPGGNDQRVYFFVATGLTRRGQHLDEGEMIDEVRPFSADELIDMIARGEIRDAKTLAGLLHLLGRRPGGIQL